MAVYGSIKFANFEKAFVAAAKSASPTSVGSAAIGSASLLAGINPVVAGGFIVGAILGSTRRGKSVSDTISNLFRF